MKSMSNKEYGDYIKTKTPNSNTLKNCLYAFFVGGIICVLGQLLLNLYEYLGIDIQNSYTLVTVTMVFAGTFLTGLNIYPKIAKYAGAGTLVPVTGFANSVAAPALEAKTEGFITGVGAKIFTIAGPVILYGTIASVISGIIYCLTKRFM